jgi:hypothetical protein
MAFRAEQVVVNSHTVPTAFISPQEGDVEVRLLGYTISGSAGGLTVDGTNPLGASAIPFAMTVVQIFGLGSVLDVLYAVTTGTSGSITLNLLYRSS